MDLLNKENPEISIIVPVYNAEHTLNQCVDSILSQTLFNIELILVDDGSPDNSGKICDTYFQNDTRVIVIHQENGGASKARNVGISEARGKYIMFCDSDDYVHPQWCELLHRTIESNPKSCVVCDVQKMTHNNPLPPPPNY